MFGVSFASRSNVIMELQTGEVVSPVCGTSYARILTQNCEIQVSVWASVWLRLELGMSFSPLMFRRYQSLLDRCFLLLMMNLAENRKVEHHKYYLLAIISWTSNDVDIYKIPS